jgi:hypothetical protein
MRDLMFVLIGSMALAVSESGPVSAAPADGTAIAKMASAESVG